MMILLSQARVPSECSARLYAGLLVLSWNLLMVDSNGRARDYLLIIGPIGGAPLKARLDDPNRGAVLMTYVHKSFKPSNLGNLPTTRYALLLLIHTDLLLSP